MPSKGNQPVDQEWLGWSPYQQQASNAWLIESPMAATEPGGGGAAGAAASAAGTAADTSRARASTTPRELRRMRSLHQGRHRRTATASQTGAPFPIPRSEPACRERARRHSELRAALEGRGQHDRGSGAGDPVDVAEALEHL